jgi:glutamine synthetase
MSNVHRNRLGIRSLPTSLEESLVALKSDLNYLEVCFKMELIETYIRLKEEEIKEIGKDKSKIKQFKLYYDI